MTDDIELKPCPFCGEMAFWDSEFAGIYCRCGAEITFCESDKEAAEKWNTRPIEDALRAENERLREVLERIGNEFKINRWIYEVLKGTKEK